MNYDKLTDSEIRKLESIERRLLRINKEIKALGYNVVLHDGNCSIIKGDTHDKRGKRIDDCVIHDFTMRGWDSVDW